MYIYIYIYIYSPAFLVIARVCIELQPVLFLSANSSQVGIPEPVSVIINVILHIILVILHSRKDR